MLHNTRKKLFVSTTAAPPRRVRVVRRALVERLIMGNNFDGNEIFATHADIRIIYTILIGRRRESPRTARRILVTVVDAHTERAYIIIYTHTYTYMTYGK